MSARGRKPEDRILYVYYDRICPKAVKKRAIARRYGKEYGPAAEPTKQGAPASSSGKSGSRDTPNSRGGQSRSGTAYAYRPARAEGGEAVRERPFKIFMEKFVNLFESIEERGLRQEREAKESAVAVKKRAEAHHTLITMLILLSVTALFVLVVYRGFFVIDTIEVEGTELYPTAEILNSVDFETGDNLYSFSAGEAEADIVFRCPYVKNASISRTVPKSVTIALEDDTAAFYTCIWGDCVKLSAGLRVLEVSPASRADTDGLIELILPPVSASVGGSVLEFDEQKNERFIRNVLGDVVRSELGQNGRITQVDLSDQYNLSLSVDGRYGVRLGVENDCDLKLKLAAKTLQSSEFDAERDASIDISSADHAIVRYGSSQRAG